MATTPTASLGTGHNTFPREMTYALREKVLSLSGDTFEIKDQDGHERFKIKGRALSLKDKKTISDDKGVDLYKLEKKMVSMHARQYIIDAKTNIKIAVMKQKSVIPFKGTRTILVWKGDKDEGDAWLECKGNLIQYKFKITEVATGKKVAEVKKSFTHLKNLLFDKDKYGVLIEPGYDNALMLLVAAAVDETYHDDSGRSGGAGGIVGSLG